MKNYFLLGWIFLNWLSGVSPMFFLFFSKSLLLKNEITEKLVIQALLLLSLNFGQSNSSSFSSYVYIEIGQLSSVSPNLEKFLFKHFSMIVPILIEET